MQAGLSQSVVHHKVHASRKVTESAAIRDRLGITTTRARVINQELDQRSARWHAMEVNLRDFMHRDICTRSAIWRLANEGVLSDDDFLEPLNDEQIVTLLSELVVLLGDNNYQLALLNRSQEQRLCKTYWLLKRGPMDSRLFLEIPADRQIVKAFSAANREVCEGFYRYFNELWEGIPPEDKNKEQVKELLNNVIAEIHKGVPKGRRGDEHRK
jgi:hypothetical protein